MFKLYLENSYDRNTDYKYANNLELFVTFLSVTKIQASNYYNNFSSIGCHGWSMYSKKSLLQSLNEGLNRVKLDASSRIQTSLLQEKKL